MIPPEVRAVVFDAVGTLIHPSPSPVDVYCRVGARYGSRRSKAEVEQRFRQAFLHEEQRDAGEEHRTGEVREEQRWRSIVHDCLADADDCDACFRELYDHFASPDAWRTPDGVGEVLTRLHERGYHLAVGSNFDHRLRAVVAGLAELTSIRHLIISSEVGWKKPAPRFFAAVADQLQRSAEQILFVGDDCVNDFDAARQAGLHAVLYDSKDAARHVQWRIRNLEELL